MAALCPNCYREIHHGVNGERKNNALQATIDQFEKRMDTNDAATA
jgi:5-methylcytosine-specific restriction enzyme A